MENHLFRYRVRVPCLRGLFHLEADYKPLYQRQFDVDLRLESAAVHSHCRIYCVGDCHPCDHFVFERFCCARHVLAKLFCIIRMDNSAGPLQPTSFLRYRLSLVHDLVVICGRADHSRDSALHLLYCDHPHGPPLHLRSCVAALLPLFPGLPSLFPSTMAA